MSFFSTSTAKYRKPKPKPKPKKQINKIGKKGGFWIFIDKILDAFFLRLDLPRVCENCHIPPGPNGPIDPAHSLRRVDIRVGDWWNALRVAALCRQCHFEFDSQGRRAAEPQIEAIIQRRFDNLGMDRAAVEKMLLECAEQVQEADALQKQPRFQEYVVFF